MDFFKNRVRGRKLSKVSPLTASSVRRQITDREPKSIPKKFLLRRFTFFSMSVTTTRTLLRILVNFFCKKATFSEDFEKMEKIDFGRFLMYISLYEGTMRDRAENASERYLHG